MGAHTSSTDGLQRVHPLTGTRFYRRSQDRGLVWVRITLLLVVSALLLCVIGGSKARNGWGGAPASPGAHGGR